MLRRPLSLICIAVVMCVGCAYDKKAPARLAGDHAQFDARPISFQPLARARSSAFFTGSVEAASRYVAVRHKLEIVEPASSVQKSLEAVVNFCTSIQCEVLSSNISGTTADSIPS